MSWSAVTSGSSGQATASSRAFTLAAPVQVGDVIVVLGNRGSTTNADMTSDVCADTLGNTYQQIWTSIDVAHSQGFVGFYTISIFSGTPTVTITSKASHGFNSTNVSVYRESGGIASLEQVVPGPVPGTAVSGLCTVATVTPRLNGELVVCLMNTANGTTTVGSGMILDLSTAIGLGIESLFQNVTAAFTVTANSSLSSDTFFSAAIIFSPTLPITPAYVPHRMPLGV